MLNTLNFIKNYDKSMHLSRITIKTNILDSLEYIYEPNWDTNPDSAPYEIVTQWVDCYYCLSYLMPYYMKISDKTYRYVASYILRGYAIEQSGFSEKYLSSSYITFKKKFPHVFQIITNSYGFAYQSIASATLTANKVSLNISDPNKLRELIENGITKIDVKIPTPAQQTINFSNEEKITFVLFSILYASRCNNFHGNVASRLNSIYSNEESFTMYTNLFLLEYITLAISLNEQNILSDSSLFKLKANEKLILS